MMLPSILTTILCIPLAGALNVMLHPKEAARTIKITGLALSLLAFVASVALFFMFDGTNGGMQFVEKVPWIPGLDISY
ncbi:hypothetical protein NL533_30920, partial [Klebsiella pneumoniae]|nr:hypothetical protein [Klebsiella pneumoniae]